MDLEALQAKRLQLAQTFKKNFGESSNDEFSSSFKDSSLKKVSSFLKKVKTVQVDQIDPLLTEIKSLNLKMHLTEVASSILENKPKNSAEIIGLLSIVVSLMIENPEFRQPFVLELLRRIELEASDLDASDKTRTSSLRWLMRMGLELHCVRVLNGQTKLNSVFEKLLLQDQEKGLKLAPFVIYFLKNFDLLTPPLPESVPVLAEFSGLGETIEKYYKGMCRYLATLHRAFLGCQEKTKQFYESKGDIGPQMASNLTDSFAKFQDAHIQVENLATSMNKILPKISDSKPKYEIIDSKIIFAGDLAFLQNKSKQIFEDEEQRLFYEDFPQFQRPDKIPEPERLAIEEPEFDETTLEEIDPEKDETPKIRIPNYVENLVKDIENIMSKDDADKIAQKIVETCPSDLFKYADILCSPMRKRMELIPLFTRICAICASIHTKFIPEIVKSIIGQFTFLLHKKVPIMGTRRRICRFISEFTKFRLFTQSQIYFCLKKCVADFNSTNIDMFCMIIEYCGRFIYLQPESHARIAHLLKVVNNKRMNSVDISSDRQINISNALFVVDPVPFQFNFKTVDQKEVYINFLMSSELKDEELCAALLELDWNDADVIKILQEEFLQPWMYQVKRAEIQTKCMLRLNAYYPVLLSGIFDKLIDNFYAIIEPSSSLLPQHSVSVVELLSRLFLFGLFDEKVLFSLLYHLLCHDHDRPNGSSSSDGSDHHFRIKLVVSLLGPALPTLTQSWLSEVSNFLKLFRCYVCSKIEISRENFEILTDLYRLANLSLLPLNLDTAVYDFSQSDGSRKLMEKLDFLRQEANADPTYSGPIGKELSPAERADYLAELDREMSKLVCHGLEQRKLERRPQQFDASIPLGLKPTSAESKFNLMLKKGSKSKPVLKPLDI